MKTNKVKSAAVVLGIFAMLAGLFSFAPKPGGDYFTISVNNKVVVEQFVHNDKTVRVVQLNESNLNDDLSIVYSHCGVTGTSRSVEVHDSKDNVVKLLHFPDAAAPKGKSPMRVRVRDLLLLKKSQGKESFKLVYSSKLMNDPMTLASLEISNESKAGLQ